MSSNFTSVYTHFVLFCCMFLRKGGVNLSSEVKKKEKLIFENALVIQLLCGDEGMNTSLNYFALTKNCSGLYSTMCAVIP